MRDSGSTRLDTVSCQTALSPSCSAELTTPRSRRRPCCLDSSISEAIGALSYFLERRERERAEQIRLAAMEVSEESLPPGFDRDLGLHLATVGVGNALIEFSAVPVHNLAVLPNGTAAWSAGLRLGGTVFLATFEVPSARVPDLARALAIPPATLRGTGALHKHSLLYISRAVNGLASRPWESRVASRAAATRAASVTADGLRPRLIPALGRVRQLKA